jgi:hypothetical protein
MEHGQLARGDGLDGAEAPGMPALEQGLGVSTAKALDHNEDDITDDVIRQAVDSS